MTIRKGLHEEQEDCDVASNHAEDPTVVSNVEIEVEDYLEELQFAGNQGDFSGPPPPPGLPQMTDEEHAAKIQAQAAIEALECFQQVSTEVAKPAWKVDLTHETLKLSNRPPPGGANDGGAGDPPGGSSYDVEGSPCRKEIRPACSKGSKARMDADTARTDRSRSVLHCTDTSGSELAHPDTSGSGLARTVHVWAQNELGTRHGAFWVWAGLPWVRTSLDKHIRQFWVCTRPEEPVPTRNKSAILLAWSV